LLWDLAGVAVRVADPVVGRVAEQVGSGNDAPALLGDERRSLADQGIDDELAGLPLELAQHRVDRDRDAGDHCRGVCVDQIGELLPIASTERTHLDR
jgi:hypothetical protein